jgi:hypothetical protein
MGPRPKASRHRCAALTEDPRCGQLAAVTVAVEVPGDRDALGVVAAETRVLAGHRTETVDERLAGERFAADPVVRIRDGSEIDREEGTHGPDAH